MKILPQDIARALVDLAHEATVERQGRLVDAALHLLEAHRFSKALRTFPRLVEAILREREGSIGAVVSTPKGALGPSGKALVHTLEGALRRNVDVEERADPSLLGGVVLSLSDDRFDASLRGALGQLAAHLRTPLHT